MKRSPKNVIAPALAFGLALAIPAGAGFAATGDGATQGGPLRLAHMSSQSQGQVMPQGGMMGSGMMGQGMMGQGQGGLGSGMMGQGQMGPGMMDQDDAGCAMAGRGQMGSGQMGMMGSGMMGSGMMGQAMPMGRVGPGGGAGFRVSKSQDLSTDDVRHYFEHRLDRGGNKRLKLGDVKQADDDTITVDIVTVDDSLVQRYAVDLHSGWVKPAQ